MKADYKKAIEKEAKAYFGDLNATMPPSMVGRTLSYFEFHLSKEGLDDDQILDAEVCHSKQIIISSKLLIDIEPLVFRIASIYGTKPIKLINYSGKKTKWLVSYIGYQHETHACYVTTKKVIELAKSRRKLAKDSVDKYLCKEEREYQMFDLFDDWIEELSCSLSPTALTREIFDDIDEYIDNQFTPHSDYLACQNTMAEFTQMLYKVDPETTNRQVMDMFQEKYGISLQDLTDQYAKLAEQDLLFEWPDQSVI